ncbi:alanine/glycine:cation symporter family protein [Arenimonas sp.]|uniref:alanine/glycine:cation symporter family protein n=1 Tax=Arenimonas sp. TaxID=1872635 RepID=UPI0039E29920
MSQVLLAALAAAATPPGIDERISRAMEPFAAVVAKIVLFPIPVGDLQIPWILFWLIAASIFCTFYFRFINVRGFVQGFRIIRGDYSDPRGPGEVSHFQALATALSGTVGLGNISGVALAVALGGPGATFWMIFAGIIGMSAKFCECTLGVMYRNQNPDGTVSGGPMYYLRKGIAEHYPALAPLGKLLGAAFAIFCIGGAIGAGNMFQANAAYQQLVFISGAGASPLSGHAALFGVVVAVLVGLVTIGGLRGIARVTDKLVPLMAAIFMLAGIVVLIAHYDRLPAAFASIIVGAFSPEGVAGGAVGVMLVGFRRAAFSNEAGVGTAAIAHSGVKTQQPITEGLVSLWEPFIDTVVMCTMTALIIVVSGVAGPGTSASGVELTANAFATVLPWFPNVLAVAVFLFAFATMIAYSYYGLKATTYLFGESKIVEAIYKFVFLALIVVGCTMDFNKLVDFSDSIFFLMAVPNVIGLYLLAPVVKRELDTYLARLKAGEIRPTREAPEAPMGSL